jgi:hypothetical protein
MPHRGLLIKRGWVDAYRCALKNFLTSLCLSFQGASVSNFKGFAELRVPRDLVQKLEYDLERIRKSPQDQYAAFDFFVTAEHIVDWIHPDDEKARKAVRRSSSLLRITSHLANGVKNFEAKAKHHRSVADIEKSRYVEAGYVEAGYVEAGYVEEGYFEDPLIVHLTSDEQKSFGQSNIEVATLAQQVFEYWKDKAPQA